MTMTNATKKNMNARLEVLKAQAREYHLQAVRLLIGQTTRYNGLDDVAIQYRPFGSATLARAGVGRMI